MFSLYKYSNSMFVFCLKYESLCLEIYKHMLIYNFVSKFKNESNKSSVCFSLLTDL